MAMLGESAPHEVGGSGGGCIFSFAGDLSLVTGSVILGILQFSCTDIVENDIPLFLCTPSYHPSDRTNNPPIKEKKMYLLLIGTEIWQTPCQLPQYLKLCQTEAVISFKVAQTAN